MTPEQVDQIFDMIKTDGNGYMSFDIERNQFFVYGFYDDVDSDTEYGSRKYLEIADVVQLCNEVIRRRTPADPNPWIPHTGQVCPPEMLNVRVQIRMRNTGTTEGIGSGFRWTVTDNQGDIIEYRPVIVQQTSVLAEIGTGH